MRAVVLSHYLIDSKFYVQTDASDIGISGILYQIDTEDNARIISLVSRVLTKFESRYTTTEKKLLAIVYSVLKFRYYLIGSEFDIVTDHKALTFLLSSPFHGARLSRWILALQEYNFTIRHCKGPNKIVADFFSRNFPDQPCQTHPNYLIWNCVRMISEKRDFVEDKVNTVRIIAEITMKRELNDIATYQASDETIQRLKIKSVKNLEIFEENRVMYVKGLNSEEWKLFLPRALVKLTMQTAHEQFGHAGAYKLLSYLNSYFFWRRMRADIKAYTKACDLCQRVKYLNYKMEGAYQFLKASEPNKMVSVDFYGPLPRSNGGVQYLFVLH